MRNLVFYEGPSRINQEPIVAIATGFKYPSENPKTGNMIQTWMLPANMRPNEAQKTGVDESVCGTCEQRWFLDGSCYVVPQAITTVWDWWKRGSYQNVTDPADLTPLFSGRQVRLGAYGDPASVPIEVWDAMLAEATWVGYTHQWERDDLRDVLKYCQASVESEEGARLARGMGVGYFRIKRETDPLMPGEIMCPSITQGKQCVDCMACRGFTGGRIAINVHGIVSSRFTPSTKDVRGLPVLNQRRVYPE